MEKLRPRPGHRHLDVAGGTGDVAFRVWDAMRASNRGYGGRSSSFPSPSSVGSAVEDATVAAEGLGAAAAEGVAKAAAGVAPPAAAERLADAAAGYKQERLQHQDQLEQQQFHRQEAQLLQQDLAQQQQVHLEEQRLRGALPAVTVCDINSAMLAEGRRKAEARGIGPESVQWVEGNAEALPFPSNSFDSYTIAFGIRNVTDRPAALREAHRWAGRHAGVWPVQKHLFVGAGSSSRLLVVLWTHSRYGPAAAVQEHEAGCITGGNCWRPHSLIIGRACLTCDRVLSLLPVALCV